MSDTPPKDRRQGEARVRRRGWLRSDGQRVAKLAMQAGLLPDEAERAVELGARMIAHRLSGHEIDRMILWVYEDAAKRPNQADRSGA